MRSIIAAILLVVALPAAARSEAAPTGRALVAAARSQIGVTLIYDPSYRPIAYPMGDVARERGVCSDVVIRAFRAIGIDLQEELHRDMKRHFAAYPKSWGLAAPDSNIDHRRVPNLATWFARRGYALAVSDDPAACLPGNVVAWALGGGSPHIGTSPTAASRTASGPWSSTISAGALGKRTRCSTTGLPAISERFRLIFSPFPAARKWLECGQPGLTAKPKDPWK